MHDVFISYAKEDKQTALTIAQALEKEGFQVWWDVEIPTGSTFDSVIEKAIKDAKCVIVLWSKHSIKSEWVHIEAAEGKNRNILIPVQIENVDIPFAFKRRQTLDISNWLSGVSDSSFDRFISDVRSTLTSDENQEKVISPVSNELKQPQERLQNVEKKSYTKYILAGLVLALAIVAVYFGSSFLFDNSNTTKLEIGDIYKNGIIFDIDPNGSSVKICSQNDLGSYNWFEAQTICKEYNQGGFTDWYLPSKEELNLIYTNLTLKGIGNFKDDWYWSSSDTDGNGWEQDFAEGYQQNNGGGNESFSSVRAIRTITLNSLKIGDIYAGGIIFQLDPDGRHGKVCSEFDLGFFNWYDAKTKSEGYIIGEYNDWYLPSKDELNLLYQNLFLNEIGDFEDEWYWSSSETNGNAWEQDFTDGYQQNDGGGNESKSFVRAVRSF